MIFGYFIVIEKFDKCIRMKELSKKGENFYQLWEKQREKKWNYVFVHGSIYWGLPMAIGAFLINSQFEIGNMSISKLLISIVVFMIGGLGYGLSQFRISYSGLKKKRLLQKK